MECRILFSRESKKKYLKMWSAEFLHSMLNVKYLSAIKSFVQRYISVSRKHAYIVLTPLNPTFI